MRATSECVYNEQSSSNKAPNVERSTPELQPWPERQQPHFPDLAGDL